jgi:hypothetical protein
MLQACRNRCIASDDPRWQRHTSANGLGCVEDALRRERVIAIESRWVHQR